MKSKQINEKSSVRIQWSDKFENYSKEKEKEIIKFIKNKYNASTVRVEFQPTNKLNIGVSNLETGDVENINTPEVQEKIILSWLKDNKIDISIEDIKKLNRRVESNLVDFNETKDNKWKVKKIVIENFLSYGERTEFDFEKLKGLTLIQGRNYSGKTTILEALIFALFNTTTKAKTADEVINKYNNAEFALIEVEIVIDGVDYKVEREVRRKWKKDRTSYTTATSLKFMTKNNEGVYEEPDKEEDRKATDKKLRENIGSYNEFLMTVVCTGDNIFDIIKAKATERGQLLTRFLGLEIYEKKEEIAKKLYNEWKLKSKIDKYSSSDLQVSIDEHIAIIDNNTKEIEQLNIDLSIIKNNKEKLNKEKQDFLTYYNNDIDPNLSNLSEQYFLDKIEKLKREIEAKKVEIETIKNEYKSDLEVFDQETYNNQTVLKNNCRTRIGDIEKDISAIEAEKNNIRDLIGAEEQKKRNTDRKLRETEGNKLVVESELTRLRNVVIQLKTGTNCPECGQKISEVDHAEKIKTRTSEGMEQKTLLEVINESIERLNANIVEFDAKILELNTNIGLEDSKILTCRENIKTIVTEIETIDTKMNDLLKVKDKISANDMIILKKEKSEVELESLEAKLVKEEENHKNYIKDLTKIDQNKELDIKIRNKTIEITEEEQRERNKQREVTSLENSNQISTVTIESNKVLIETIKKEEHISKIFLSYIHMVGKNGISKTIMSNSIPVLNLELAKFLRDSAEFTVEIEINMKNNEVEFWLVDNETGIKQYLISASGYEKTIAALSIRIVNSKINALPKPSLLLIDEIFSTVDMENFELIKIFMDKVSATIDNVFMITHSELVKEWADNIVTITKVNSISKATF